MHCDCYCRASQGCMHTLHRCDRKRALVPPTPCHHATSRPPSFCLWCSAVHPAAAFYDGPVLLTSLNVVKNFVLLGDVAHSVQFVRYKDEASGQLPSRHRVAIVLWDVYWIPAGRQHRVITACLQPLTCRALHVRSFALDTPPSTPSPAPANMHAGPPAVAAVQGLQPSRRSRLAVPHKRVRLDWWTAGPLWFI